MRLSLHGLPVTCTALPLHSWPWTDASAMSAKAEASLQAGLSQDWQREEPTIERPSEGISAPSPAIAHAYVRPWHRRGSRSSRATGSYLATSARRASTQQAAKFDKHFLGIQPGRQPDNALQQASTQPPAPSHKTSPASHPWGFSAQELQLTAARLSTSAHMLSHDT